MSYAVAENPTPLRQFLRSEPYITIDVPADNDLLSVTKRAFANCQHYYDKVTVTRRTEMLEERFRELVDEWLEATRFESSVSRMVAHQAYRAIIDLGEQAVPLLLRELQNRPHFWFAALRQITGANPVNEEDRGHLDRMAQAWLQWGREQHLT